MDLLASVANKRLTAWLSPVDATLTKNRGVRLTRNPVRISALKSAARRPDVSALAKKIFLATR
jgi:hypothetical protein